MAKNNGRILIPRFLDMQAAREINDLVYRSTGCFLFMTLPEEKLLCPRPTTPGGDNYTYNVLNLYKMYNDYGHFFFWWSLQKSQLPQYQGNQDEDLSEKYDDLQLEQSRVIEHYTFVTRTARHVLAHGIFQLPSMLNPYSNPKISAIERVFGGVLSEQSWPENGNDWRTINRWLVSEADFVYDWIKNWALLWANCAEEKEELQNKFYFGRWGYSKNKDECTLIEGQEGVLANYEGTSFLMYDEKSDALSSFARAFPFQHIYDAKDYLVAVAPGCVRSQYEEGCFWRSDRPDVNLKFLCRNINFYGIENVRKQLLNPKGTVSLCPDVYRLYLEGLIKKIVTLPVINTTSKRASRFRRK